MNSIPSYFKSNNPSRNPPPSNFLTSPNISIEENVSTIAKASFSLPNLISNVSKLSVALLTVSYLDLNLSKQIEKYASQKLGLCLIKMLPQKHGVNLLSKLIKPLAILNTKISALFGTNLSAQLFIPAVCEELEFRWFVQEILLHQLPKQILEISAPDLAKKLETLPARISRVAVAALIFALCHTQVLDCTQGGGISQLMGGLFYGSLYEFTDVSMVNCINLHFLYNCLSLLTKQ
jgi:hypothetical protein